MSSVGLCSGESRASIAVGRLRVAVMGAELYCATGNGGLGNGSCVRCAYCVAQPRALAAVLTDGSISTWCSVRPSGTASGMYLMQIELTQ